MPLVTAENVAIAHFGAEKNKTDARIRKVKKKIVIKELHINVSKLHASRHALGQMMSPQPSSPVEPPEILQHSLASH